jgi:hypothetical protein
MDRRLVAPLFFMTPAPSYSTVVIFSLMVTQSQIMRGRHEKKGSEDRKERCELFMNATNKRARMGTMKAENKKSNNNRYWYN